MTTKQGRFNILTIVLKPNNIKLLRYFIALINKIICAK